MRYYFKVHKEKNGFWGECTDLPGCFSQGDTLDELKNNLTEALNLYLDEPVDSKVIFSLPKKKPKTGNFLGIEVDPQIALAFLVRRERLKKGWTQKTAANELGVPLYSYQKLESSKTNNPEWKTLVKLCRIFPAINLKEAAL